MDRDRIIAQYELDTKAFKAEIKEIGRAYLSVEKVGVETAKKTGNAFSNAANKLHAAGKKVGSSFNQLGASLGPLMATMGVAFGTQQVIAFGKESIKSFADAEKNAQLLLFALKGNISAQSRLIELSGKLQDTTIFSDDDIQQAATFLALEGRAPDQIEKVIKAATELSTVTGQDLNTAVMTVNATYEGSIGKLGKLDSAFKHLTPKQLENGAAVDLLLKKYGGLAEEMGNTSVGKMKKMENAFDDVREQIGEQLIPTVTSLLQGLTALAKQDFAGGIDGLSAAIQKGIPFVQEIREAYKAFSEGKFWKGLANTGEAVLSAITFGFYTRVKNYFTPAAKIIGDGYTDFEKNKFKIIQATDQEIAAERKLREEQGQNIAEFDRYVKSVREAQIKQTFDEISQALEITKEQYKELTDLSDKYGISARINSSLMLDARDAVIKMNDATLDSETRLANQKKLLDGFYEANAKIGVTFDDYKKWLKTLEDIPPATDDVTKSTAKMVGPYDQLTASVNKSMKALQDQVTLFSQSNGSWEDALILAQKYADNQNELVKVNDLVTKSLQRQTREGVLPLNTINQAAIRLEIERFKFTKEMADKRDAIFQQAGVNQINVYEQTLDQLKKLQADEIRASDGTLKAIAAITEKYTAAIQAIQLEHFAQVSQGIGNIFGSINQAITNIFGDANAKTQEFLQLQTEALEQGNTALAEIYGKAAADAKAFADFQQALTLIEVGFAQAGAIANAIKSISSGNPLDVIAGIASLITAIGTIFGTLFSDLNNSKTPPIPQFAQGTDRVVGGVRGKDSVHAMLMPDEAVIQSDKNMAVPGLAKAWNDGKLTDFVMSKWVVPALQEQEKRLQDNFATNMANSLILQQSKFDDARLKNAIDHGNNINKYGFKHLIDALSKKPKRRGGNA